MCDVYFLWRRNFPTGCDELAVATDRQRHEDQEYSSPPAHCKCNDPGILVFVSVLILAMIQDQALVASKHFLVETEDKNLADNAEGPSVGWDRREVVKTVNGVQIDGDDYWMGKK